MRTSVNPDKNFYQTKRGVLMALIKRAYAQIQNGRLEVYEVGSKGTKRYFFNEEKTQTEDATIALIMLITNSHGSLIGFNLLNSKEEISATVYSQTICVEYM